jgi:preprotein translocase subunit SecG
MTTILFFVQAGLVVMIVIAVLLQKSSSIGLGAYSGTNESVFGAKGPAGFLTKVTFVLGFLFLANTITLGYMYAEQKNNSVTDVLVDKNNIVAPTINVVSDINTTK